MSAERTFVLSCPALGFCEDVEADSFDDAVSVIRRSGYFDQQFGDYLAGGEPEAMFRPRFLEVHVLNTSTRETATYEFAAGFILSGPGSMDLVRPKAVGE